MNYITLLASDDYLGGVIVVNNCLIKTKCKYKLVVCITDTLSDETMKVLENLKLETVCVESLECKYVPQKNKWRLTYTKLHLFGLTQYEKVVYIDADMVILENLDHLFDKPHMSAVAAGNWTNIKDETYCLNSGLMVIVPNVKDHESLIAIASSSLKKQSGKNFLCDQDVINYHFCDWYQHSELHLGLNYNLFVNQVSHLNKKFYLKDFNENDKDLPKVAVLHYLTPKPWVSKDIHLIPAKSKFLFDLWHDIKMT